MFTHKLENPVMMQRVISTVVSTEFTGINIHFYDDGASLLVFTLETHKMYVLRFDLRTLAFYASFFLQRMFFY